MYLVSSAMFMQAATTKSSWSGLCLSWKIRLVVITSYFMFYGRRWKKILFVSKKVHLYRKLPKYGAIGAAFLNSEFFTLVFRTTSALSELLPYIIALVVLFLLTMLESDELTTPHIASVHVNKKLVYCPLSAVQLDNFQYFPTYLQINNLL